MFFRKLLGHSAPDATARTSNNSSASNGGQHTMSACLQRKFARGVQYNIRIIIKGDRDVGKTCLFHRLQGNKFIEIYNPSEEIKAASIQWSYDSSDEVVKVDIWDIVDIGKKSPVNISEVPLKINNKDQHKTEIGTCLDAEFIDVYKDTQGVILMFNLSKPWTYDYIVKELLKVPYDIPTLVLGNFRDQITHDNKPCVNSSKMHSFIKTVRHHNDAPIRYGECSMKNGYGLKFIHTFFNLPFLHLQRKTLIQKLSRNNEEISNVMIHMDKHKSSSEQNYDVFLDDLMHPSTNNATSIKRSQSYDIESLHSSSTFNIPSSKSSIQINEMVTTPKNDTSANIDQFLPETASSFDEFNFDSKKSHSINGQDDDDEDEDEVEDGEEDEEEDRVNPLVAQIEDDISSDDNFNFENFGNADQEPNCEEEEEEEKLQNPQSKRVTDIMQKFNVKCSEGSILPTETFTGSPAHNLQQNLQQDLHQNPQQDLQTRQSRYSLSSVPSLDSNHPPSIHNLEDNLPDNLQDNELDNIQDNMSDNLQDNLPDNLQDNLPDDLNDSLPDNLQDTLPDNLQDNVLENPQDNNTQQQQQLVFVDEDFAVLDIASHCDEITDHQIQEKQQKSKKKNNLSNKAEKEKQTKRPKTLQINESSSSEDCEKKDAVTPLYQVLTFNEDISAEELANPLNEKIEHTEMNKKKKEKKSKKKKNKDSDKKKRKSLKTTTEETTRKSERKTEYEEF